MRVLAIGDIHGCSRALDLLLAEARPAVADLIVTLGDYVDRGPDTKGVINRLLGLREQGHHLVCLRGNHDVMMMEARHSAEGLRDWLRCGGREALASYAEPGREGKVQDVPEAHWDFLDTGCVNWYETDTHFFVHANAYPDLALHEQPTYMLHWEKLYDVRPHVSGKIMVCGHTAQKTGDPLHLGHVICIDTWVYGLGWLTCLELNTGRLWQANQRGERREGRIDDYAANR
jgi:serine/threonine protein phosphatase 1